MKNIIRCLAVIGLCVLCASVAFGQISPVKLKVSKRQKTDTKETFRSTDGQFRSSQKNKTIYYTIDLTNISSGPAKEFVVKWSLVWQGSGYWSVGTSGGTIHSSTPHVKKGEKAISLDFGRNQSFDTETLELSSSESVDPWAQRAEHGPKLLGYIVEVFVNDQCVATDVQPSNLKTKLGQGKDASGPKRHQF